MAQLGARLNGIEKVEGSNPSGSTKKAMAGVVSHPRESRLYAEIPAGAGGARQAELAC